MHSRWRFSLVVPMTLLAFAGCRKESASTGGSGGTASSPPSATRTATTQLEANGDIPTIPPATPVPLLLDDRLTPGVWLSVNGRAEAVVPSGWPLIVTATVLGAAGTSAEFSVDDVDLDVTDVAGTKVAWPLVRVSKIAKLKVDETTDATLTWVDADTAALLTGKYTVTASLKGGRGNAVTVNIGNSTSTQPADAEAERFALDIEARLLLGDGTAALQRADARVAAFPNDLLGFSLKGDALAFVGRKKDARATYAHAIKLFSSEHVKDHAVPSRLLAKLHMVSENKPERGTELLNDQSK